MYAQSSLNFLYFLPCLFYPFLFALPCFTFFLNIAFKSNECRVSVSVYFQRALGPVYRNWSLIKSLLTRQGCVRLRLGVMLCLFLSNQGVHFYICVCACLCVRLCVWQRRMYVHLYWWGYLFCDSRHHADLISIITACQPGASGTWCQAILHTPVCSKCFLVF